MFFLKRAYQINIEKREPFCCTHFKNLTRNNFRQFIHKFKDIIEVEIKSNPCFYKLKGLNVSSLRNFVTDEAKGVIMLSLLENLKEQQPAIHDLKFSIESNIHQYLKENYPVNQNNNGIKLQVPSFDKNILIKAMIYPKNIQLDIGCSYKPFIYDLSGTLNLCSILGQISFYLHIISHQNAKIPLISSWVITHYHFGKDGSETWSGKSFHLTFDEVFCGTVRFYSKKYPDGKVISRFENIVTPKITLEQELHRIEESFKQSSA